MATQVEESPLEARADRLRRRKNRKNAKADRLEARGKTKRAAKKRGAAKVKTAKADKIAGKQKAKDDKQAGKQAKKLAKVKGKVDKKAEKKENKSTKKAERKKERGKKVKKAKADIVAAGKKVSDAAKGAKDKVKDSKVGKAVSKKKRQMKAAVGAFKGTNMEGPSMGVHDAETDYRSHAMDNMGKENKSGILDGNPRAGYYGSAMHGPSKYDNAHTLKNPGHHLAPSMSGKTKKMFSTKGPKYGGGSPISKFFGRNKSKKR